MSQTDTTTAAPYDPDRTCLYTPEELMRRAPDGRSLDDRIYDHFARHGARHPDSEAEALAQRRHDHAIDQALGRLIGRSPEERLESRIVGIMGGHRLSRRDPEYAATARIAQLLAQHDPPYLVATGGGPGAMEAGNLGAALAHHPPEALAAAREALAHGPDWADDPSGYLDRGEEVAREYGPLSPSLSIPTWFYGHEPANVFASRIAKYFSNGLREEGLLAICLHGIVFAPGASGTLQEIFTDYAQNSYASYDYLSPMVFFGEDRYHDVYQLLRSEATAEVRPLLAIADIPEEIVAAIAARPPRRPG